MAFAGWSGIQLSVRAAATAIVSLLAAQWLQLEHPIYAFIAAVIVTDLQPSVSRSLGLRRLLATAIGALCGALLSFAVAPGPWGVGVGILAAMLLAQALSAGDGARVAGYICGIVLLDHSAEPGPMPFCASLKLRLECSRHGPSAASRSSSISTSQRIKQLDKATINNVIGTQPCGVPGFPLPKPSGTMHGRVAQYMSASGDGRRFLGRG